MLILSFLVCAMFYIGTWCYTKWIPLFLMDFYGYSSFDNFLLVFYFAIGAFLSTYLFGFLLNKFGNLKMFVLCIVFIVQIMIIQHFMKSLVINCLLHFILGISFNVSLWLINRLFLNNPVEKSIYNGLIQFGKVLGVLITYFQYQNIPQIFSFIALFTLLPYLFIEEQNHNMILLQDTTTVHLYEVFRQYPKYFLTVLGLEFSDSLLSSFLVFGLKITGMDSADAFNRLLVLYIGKLLLSYPLYKMFQHQNIHSLKNVSKFILCISFITIFVNPDHWLFFICIFMLGGCFVLKGLAANMMKDQQHQFSLYTFTNQVNILSTVISYFIGIIICKLDGIFGLFIVIFIIQVVLLRNINYNKTN